MAYFKIYGNQKVDYVYATKGEIKDPSINIITTNTVLQSLYQTSTQAIQPTKNAQTTSYSIYRKTPKQQFYDYIATENQVLSIKDFNVANQSSYHYRVFPEGQDQQGNYYGALETLNEDGSLKYVDTEWWDWSITGLIPTAEEGIFLADENNIWVFDYNIQSGSINSNINSVVNNNLSRYPSIVHGKNNSLSGSLSCLIGSINNSTGMYYNTVDKITAWENFVNNPNPKLLKDRLGRKIIVDIISQPTGQYMDETQQQLYTINFEWMEIENADNVSVISYE